MRGALRTGLLKAEEMRRENGKMPSAIDLRREIKLWFDSTYDYARHHINPVCKTSIAILRSFRKNRIRRKNGNPKAIPEVTKLAMRIDSMLFRVYEDQIRVTLRPGQYEYIPINKKSKKFKEYSKNDISEIMLMERVVSVSYSFREPKKITKKIVGVDLNLNNISCTVMKEGRIERVLDVSTSNISKIQNDYSKRQSRNQKHIRNPKKRHQKVRDTRKRQRNRIKNEMHNISTNLVKKLPGSTFVLEDLTYIRRLPRRFTKVITKKLNRWPYREFQEMINYKSSYKTEYVNPGGTSSECPVCGGKLQHPTWKISRCRTCDRDYDRDRLASLAIALRYYDLCGDPLPVSARASISSMMDEYPYAMTQPERSGQDRTKMIYASNKEHLKTDLNPLNIIRSYKKN